MIFESDYIKENAEFLKINNYKDEIEYYKNIFSNSFITSDDYKFDDNNVLIPGKNKSSWTTINFYIPLKISKKNVIPLEINLQIYNKAPLFTIFCKDKDMLYKEHEYVINIWPYLHHRKFLRKHIRMITKNSPTIDMLNYPLTFSNENEWKHLHSNLYLLSRAKINVNEMKIHNYTGNIFRWSLHKYVGQKGKDFLLMLLIYEYISPVSNQKIIRSCSMGIFKSSLTDWINSGMMIEE